MSEPIMDWKGATQRHEKKIIKVYAWIDNRVAVFEGSVTFDESLRIPQTLASMGLRLTSAYQHVTEVRIDGEKIE